MARMPIEVVLVGEREESSVQEALALCNGLQGEFDYSRLPPDAEQGFQMLSFQRIYAPNFLDSMQSVRDHMRGFHPFMVGVVDAPVDGNDYSNLFGSSRAESGLGVITTANVADLIIPQTKMQAYFLYYFARYAHCFIAPHHKNHDDTRGCIYDRKVQKMDLLKSMRAGAFCDDCRSRLVSGDRPLSAKQFGALETLFGECGRIMSDARPQQTNDHLRVFIGSSTEGLSIARKLQASLAEQFNVEIWNQGTVFGLGTHTLEALEAAVTTYDYGIFVFTPDDSLLSRGEAKPVARDNVIFELGLFTGRLGRNRAFIVRPKGTAVNLPTDLAGVTTATYDHTITNLAAALEPACEKIREAVGLANPVAAPDANRAVRGRRR